LKKDGEIFTGILPSKIVVSNYTIHWSGKDWAMIAMIPALWKIDTADIISLLAHELFHKAQPSLHFPRNNDPNNSHLDKKDGRIYLRLELNALLKAVNATSTKEMKIHVRNALTFRKYRYMLYPGADSTENAWI
jgi:hypothetical protein